MIAWLSPLPVAVGIGLLLELVYAAVVRRFFVRFFERLRYQLWAVALVFLVYLARGGAALLPAPVWSWTALVAVVLAVDVGYEALDRLWLSRLHEARRLAIPKLVRDLIGWILLVAAALAAGSFLFADFRFGTWALPSAVVSAVLGFSLQDVLKNLFAGLALQTEAPFDAGDWLMVDGEARQVVEMTWRSTRLRNSLGVEFVEPNANVAAARLTNLGSGNTPMGFEVRIGLAYGDPPAKIKASLERAARSSPLVSESPEPVALLTSYGDSAIVYRLRFWSTAVHRFARLHDEVLSRVWYQLRRDGLVVPFPIRTVEHDASQRIVRSRREETTRRAAELFAKVDVLAALPAEILARLAEEARHEHFDRGERLVSEGEGGDSLMVIARGRVLVSKSGAEIGASSSVALATLGEDQYFGEMSLLTGAPRSATVSAEEPVEVYVLDRAALAPILTEDPALAETLSLILAERAAATAARFEDRRGQLREGPAAEQRSLLGRIQSFFRLS